FMAENERYRRSFEEVLATYRERNVAVQIIKSIARGPWATTDRTHTTWYQPLEEQADIDRAVHWVLGVPGVFLNTVGDLALLPKVVDPAWRRPCGRVAPPTWRATPSITAAGCWPPATIGRSTPTGGSPSGRCFIGRTCTSASTTACRPGPSTSTRASAASTPGRTGCASR